jgi:hypothetical protein
VAELQFLSLREFQAPSGAVAYRHRVWTAALNLLVLGGVSLALLYVAWRGGVRFNNRGDGIPPFIGWFAGGVLLLFTRAVPYVFLRQRLKPSNWLVLRSADGLFVKYRSYLNAHFPEDDAQIVFIPYGAIGAARVHRRRWLVPSSQGRTQHQRATFVELRLRDPQQAQELAARLAAERINKGPRLKTWYGARSRSRYQDFPVQVTTDGTLAITWNVAPGAEQFLADIAARVEIDDAARTDYNWRQPASVNEDAAAMTMLGRMGDSFAVIRLLRRKFGLSLGDAKTQSEEIRRQP